jgi:hypothetical protein
VAPISLVSSCSLCIYVNRNIFCPPRRTQCGSERVPKRMSKKGNLLSPVLPWSSQRNWPLETLCVCVCVCRLHIICVYLLLRPIFPRASVCLLSISRLVLVHASHAYQVHPSAVCVLVDITRANGTRRHYILKGVTLHFIDLVHHTLWLTHTAKSATDSGSAKSFFVIRGVQFWAIFCSVRALNRNFGLGFIFCYVEWRQSPMVFALGPYQYIKACWWMCTCVFGACQNCTYDGFCCVHKN